MEKVFLLCNKRRLMDLTTGINAWWNLSVRETVGSIQFCSDLTAFYAINPKPKQNKKKRKFWHNFVRWSYQILWFFFENAYIFIECKDKNKQNPGDFLSILTVLDFLEHYYIKLYILNAVNDKEWRRFVVGIFWKFSIQEKKKSGP